MKKTLLAMAIGLAFASPLLHAASKASLTTPGSSNTQSPNTASFDKNLARFQEQMSVMNAQMDQIRKTQDPQARQKLLQQHWDSMQSAMNTMRGMWEPGMMGYGGMGPGMMGRGGPGMMGGAGTGGGWGHMGGYYSHLTPEQLRKRQYMSDQYLRMQQEMMNNMMWHQQYWMMPPEGTK
ncbi:hypothetical protein [Burkholderia ubonensis]|uniref:hypothetical protein n=1 Tax=Burkholderia ubonensis TaxID=101571 RepID=UPI000F57D3D0|nr:hypothetical protein [Burkholderia ubonensis]RQP27055.1 hypothetical protein DF155_34455 [Burkholderia ubonensis]RQP28636.1 hypothetical protein DF154_34425 [Burkholderia ubonensis]RQP29535.1 hypothetical protein DF156_34450 [Burkholderia ubonensis]RQP45998.1 hypothetical protein DF144_34225 [Burkholderia ubonensis]RQP48812.1 hypothetical protein DF151_34385 [Burkholderia ubonensis]